MTLLVLSIVFFLVGVWLPGLLGSKKHLLQRFDRALALIVLLIVLLDLLPESYAAAGLWFIPAALLGALLPWMIERTQQHKDVHAFEFLAVTAVLMVHAALDGSAIALAEVRPEPAHDHLAFAIVLHRLPFGLALGALLSRIWSQKMAMVGIGAMVVATVVGYGFGAEQFLATSEGAIGVFQALVSGTLLHVATTHLPFFKAAHRH